MAAAQPVIYPVDDTRRCFPASRDAREAVINGAASHGRVDRIDMHRGETTSRRHQSRVWFLQYFASDVGAMRAYVQLVHWYAVSENVQLMTRAAGLTMLARCSATHAGADARPT